VTRGLPAVLALAVIGAAGFRISAAPQATRPSVVRAVPKRSPFAAMRSMMSFFSVNGSTSTSATISSACSRFLNASCGLAIVSP